MSRVRTNFLSKQLPHIAGEAALRELSCQYAFGLGAPASTLTSCEKQGPKLMLRLVANQRPESKTHRDIYLTPPGPTGRGLIKIANGAGSTWAAC